MADRSILAAAEWESQLREALLASDTVLLLMTPRSKNSLWVAAEAGAAWVLRKPLIPVLQFVEPQELFEPIRKYETRLAETPEQTAALVRELSGVPFGLRQQAHGPEERSGFNLQPLGEIFTAPRDWDALLRVAEWLFDRNTGAISGEGMYRYLLSHGTYGSHPFTLRCSLSFMELRPQSRIDAVNAGIVLAWNIPRRARQYLHLMFTGKRLLLEKIGFRDGDEYLDYEHVDAGVEFELEPLRPYEFLVRVSGNTISVEQSGQELYAVTLAGGIPVGRVGLRPWRSHMQCNRFEVTS